MHLILSLRCTVFKALQRTQSHLRKCVCTSDASANAEPAVVKQKGDVFRQAKKQACAKQTLKRDHKRIVTALTINARHRTRLRLHGIAKPQNAVCKKNIFRASKKLTKNDKSRL